MGSAPAPADPSPDDVITLREITRESYMQILRLEVSDEQEPFVASNAASLAQAHFHEEAFYRGIYVDDTAVGFMMLECWPEEGDVGLWRFMIDHRYQGRGYGTAAIALIVELVRNTFEYTDCLLVSHVDKPGHPGPFYERCGFTYTGEVHDGEPVMSIPLRDLPAEA
jgi:diamine N-acetyltransferase